MAVQLSQQKRIELFKAYCDRRSIQSVARKCSVCPTTALRYKRMDHWDERLSGIKQKTEEKVDDSIAEMEARQARQARAIQAKALQRIIEGGFRSSKDAADAYFKAVQEERVIRGEPSDRVDLVQNDMRQIDRNYEVFKEALKDEEYRRLSDRMVQLWWEVGRASHPGKSRSASSDGHIADASFLCYLRRRQTRSSSACRHSLFGSYCGGLGGTEDRLFHQGRVSTASTRCRAP